jgi:lipid-A-disaccharide synthase-like uncharacterized protein
MSKTVWLVIGFLGQGLFTARFLVQWIYSEKKRKSLIPTAFWYFSMERIPFLLPAKPLVLLSIYVTSC